MKNYIEERVKNVAQHIIDTDMTLRQTAEVFKVNKSTIHKDIRERLSSLDPNMAMEVQEIMDHHTLTRHINGGKATKEKYIKQRDDS